MSVGVMFGFGPDVERTSQPSSWSECCKHTPLAGRTDDPEALLFDRAVATFRAGLRCCREGNLDLGVNLVATALFMDYTCGRIYLSPLPESYPEAGFCFLDADLMKRLHNYDEGSSGEPSIECVVFRLAMCVPRSVDQAFNNRQERIAISLRESEQLIQSIEKDPSMESGNKDGPLNGYLTRVGLHSLRSFLYRSLGNHHKSAREMSAALAIDPSLVAIRARLTALEMGLGMQQPETLFRETKRVVDESHPDRRDLDVDYAYLSVLTLTYPEFGSVEEAQHYREMSHKATARQRELYGPHFGDPKLALKQMEDEFQTLRERPGLLLERMHGESIHERIAEIGAQSHSCLGCGTIRPNLLRCTRCRLVSYCSKQCQQQDWKKHKVACKIMATSSSSKQST